jgi:gliding motility-associated-like protein
LKKLLKPSFRIRSKVMLLSFIDCLRNKIALKFGLASFFIITASVCKAQLIVDFTVNESSNTNVDTICIPDTRNFIPLCSFNGQSITIGSSSNFVFQWNLNNKNSNISEFNPTVTYDEVGAFTVSLKVTHIATGETKTATKAAYLRAFEKPKADLGDASVVGCAPLSYTFNDASSSSNGGISSYSWSISGAGIKSEQNPTFNFLSQGFYNLTLQVVDEVGCKDDTTVIRVVEIIPNPDPSITIDPSTACDPPLDVGLSTNLGPEFSHEWIVEGIPGSTLGNNQVVSVNSSGYFDVNLKVGGALNCDIDSVFVDAIIIDKPSVDFSFNDPGCLNTNVVFTNNSTGSATSYIWDFGDNTSVASAPGNTTVVHKYIAPGTYTVKLTAVTKDNACDEEITKEITIEDIKASFTVDKTRFCEIPAIVNFDASSSTIPPGSTVEWVIKRNTNPKTEYRPTGTNPSVTITQFGLYDVQLIIRSPSGCVSSIFLKDYIQVVSISALVSSDVRKGCAPLDVEFKELTDHKGFVPKNRTWDFDDGIIQGPSLGNDVVTHTFVDTGVYVVKVTVEYEEGCIYEETRVIEVGSPPDVKFWRDPFISCAFDSTTFLDSSSVLVNGVPDYDLPDEWRWSFLQGGVVVESGGGRQIFLQHQDSATTTAIDTLYDVELIVGWRGCYDTLYTEASYAKLGPTVNQRVAEYDCKLGQVILYADSNRASKVWWEIMSNDSVITNQARDTVTLPPGTYDLRTIAINPATGCHYRDSTRTVIVPEVIFPEIEQLTDSVMCLSSIPQCNTAPNAAPNLCRHFFDVKNLLFGDKVTATIKHEDGALVPNVKFGSTTPTNRFFFTPNRPGKYFIEVAILDADRKCPRVLYDTARYFYPELTVENEVGGLGGCAPLSLDLNGVELFGEDMVFNSTQWRVKTPSGGVLLNHITDNNPDIINLVANGTYPVTVVGTARDTISGLVCPIIVQNENKVEIVVADPKPNFDLTKARFCAGDSIEINNLTNTSIPLSYTWLLEGGGSSTDSVPTLVGLSADTLSITLQVTDNLNCNAEITLTDTVIIEAAPQTIDILADKAIANCPPLITELYPVVAPKYDDYSYTWYVDGENASILDTAIVVKSLPGMYGAKLVVSTPAGCSDSTRIEDVLTISGPSGELLLDKDTICVGDEIKIDVINSVNVTELQYVYGDGFAEYAGPTDLTKNHIYATVTGDVFVSVFLDPITASNPEGCNVLLSKKIFVNEILADFDLSNDSLCGPDNVTVTDVSVGTNYESLFTVNPLGLTFQNEASFTNLFDVGVYSISLKISDEISGCENEIDKTLWVFPDPNTTISPDSILCAGEKVVISATGGVSYEWTDPEGGSLNETDVPTVEANPNNTVTYSVLIRDANHCEATETVTISRDKTNLDYTLKEIVACETLDLDVTNNSVGENFFWDFGDGNSSTDRDPDQTYNGADTYNGRVEVYDLSARCKQTDDFTILINPAPTYTKSADQGLCLGENNTLLVVGKDQISWTVDPISETLPSGFSTVVSPSTDVKYTFVVTADATGCTSTDSISIIVDNPKASFDMEIVDSCGSSTINLLNPSPGLNQQFYPGDGSAPLFPLNSYTYGSVGEYVISYVVFDRIERCADSTFKTVNVHPVPGISKSDDVEICNYETAVLSASGGNSYKWTPSSGILGLDNISDIVVKPDTTTSYKVVVGNEFMCFDSAEILVFVHKDFNFDIIPDTTLIIGEFLDMNLNPDMDVNITWKEEKWLNCTSCSFQTVQPLSSVCYEITLEDKNGCYPKEIKPCITIDERYSMDVPKAFTPNDDNINDVIFVRGFGIKELYEFAIFNRWGEEVFISNDIRFGWDGQYKGKVQNDETFVYRAKVLFWNGETAAKTGYITILK